MKTKDFLVVPDVSSATGHQMAQLLLAVEKVQPLVQQDLSYPHPSLQKVQGLEMLCHHPSTTLAHSLLFHKEDYTSR